VGPGGQGTPHVIDSKQSSGAAWHCAAVAHRRRASPVMTSMLRDLRDLAKLLSHLAGLIVDSKADGGGHGGAAGLDHGGTPVEAKVTQINAWTSTSGLQGSCCSRYRGLRWSGWAWPRRRRVAEELRRGVARHWGLPSLVSEHGREQWVAEKTVELW